VSNWEQRKTPKENVRQGHKLGKVAKVSSETLKTQVKVSGLWPCKGGERDGGRAVVGKGVAKEEEPAAPGKR